MWKFKIETTTYHFKSLWEERPLFIAAGLVTTCNTQFSCGKSQRIIFVDLNWSEKNEIAGRSIKARTRKFTFEDINITLISIPTGRIIKK